MFEKVVEVLIAVDGNPAAQRKWRLMIAIIVLVLIVFVMWAIGSFEKFNLPGFAMSAEVDAHITRAISPVHEEQLKNSQKLESLADQVRDSLAETKASEIRAVAVKRCKEKNSDQREYLNREIDRAQSEYFKLVSRYYAIPACDSL